MTYEGWASKGLGHQVSGVVCRWNIFQIDIVTLDGVADEVELNPNVTVSGIPVHTFQYPCTVPASRQKC